jgi:NitT/TauT family transport system substrate-binding protein
MTRCLGLLILVASLVACQAASAPVATVRPTSQTVDKVKLGISSVSFAWAPLILAVSKGYFREEGLDVEIVQTQSGPGIVNAVMSGHVDLAANLLASNAQAIKGGVTNRPLAVAGLVGEHNHQLVLKRTFAARRGITPESPLSEKIQALRGAKLGITAVGSGADRITRLLLQSAGVTPDQEVELTAAGSVNSVLAAFLSDRIDGFLLAPPITDQAAAQGNGVLMLDLSKGDWPSALHATYTVMFATEEFVRAKPGVVLKAVRAIEKSLKFSADRSAEANAVLKAEYFPDMAADLFDSAVQVNERTLAKSVVLDEEGVVTSLRLNLEGAENMKFADVATNEFATRAAAELANWKP